MITHITFKFLLIRNVTQLYILHFDSFQRTGDDRNETKKDFVWDFNWYVFQILSNISNAVYIYSNIHYGVKN